MWSWYAFSHLRNSSGSERLEDGLRQEEGENGRKGELELVFLQAGKQPSPGHSFVFMQSFRSQLNIFSLFT